MRDKACSFGDCAVSEVEVGSWVVRRFSAASRLRKISWALAQQRFAAGDQERLSERRAALRDAVGIERENPAGLRHRHQLPGKDKINGGGCS